MAVRDLHGELAGSNAYYGALTAQLARGRYCGSSLLGYLTLE